MSVPSAESTLTLPLSAVLAALDDPIDARIDAAAAWATGPLQEAEALADTLPDFAITHEISPMRWRMIAAVASGDADPSSLRALADDAPEVVAMLARVRAIGAGMRTLPVRTRAARQDALRLALAAAAQHRDDTAAGRTKAHAERVRDELSRLPIRVAAVKRKLLGLFALSRPMRRIPTARLSVA